MTGVVFYRDADGTVPLLRWLDDLPAKARLACIARVELLQEHGHRLRRPHAENLGQGIWELRAKVEGIDYRMLYFFHGEEAIVLSHGVVKQEAAVPPIEITRAVRRKRAFEVSPQRHTHEET